MANDALKAARQYLTGMLSYDEALRRLANNGHYDFVEDAKEDLESAIEQINASRIAKPLPAAETSIKALRAKYAVKSILVDYDGDDVPYIQEQNSHWWATARLDRKNNVWRIDGREAQKLADELVRRGGRIIR